MPDDEETLMSIHEAAAYVGLTVPGLRTHIYRIGDLKPAGTFGHSLVFHKRDLNAFLKRKRPAHRPRKAQTKPKR